MTGAGGAVPPSVAAVAAFLADLHRAPVGDVEPLPGGFWSAAFSYRLGTDDLVARFGAIRSGFEADQAAMAYSSDALPVPEVLDIGDAFGQSYAISRRHHGRFLEDVGVDEVETTRPMLRRLLHALRTVPDDNRVPGDSWRQWLLNGLADDQPSAATSGWRRRLEAMPDEDRLFRAAERRVRELVPDCPERRDLVHGDLLNRNVLVADDASAVTAVFSWKCSTRGDHLYDAAWCTFWGAVAHPGIAAIDVWALMTDDFAGDHAALDDAAMRHHCYELQIGASHLGWHAWTGDGAALAGVARTTAAILERGPRTSSAF